MSSQKEILSLQAQLTDKLLNIFDVVIQERQKYYKKNEKPALSEIEKIISSTSNQNAFISGTSGLIPGPWGMLAAVPEIVLIVHNIVKMIYDIGIAHGKEKFLDRELLAGTVLMSMDVAGIGILTMQGGKLVVKRTSLKVFQKKIQMLGLRISEQLLKSIVAKWIPLVGSAAMASWSKYSTLSIGKRASEILSKPIEIDEKEIHDEIPAVEIDAKPPSINFDELKVMALINLMKIDKKVDEKEKEFIVEIVNNVDFTEIQRAKLIGHIDSKEKLKVDYSLFKNSPDECIGLLVDLIALAKREGEFHLSEKLFIKQVGAQIGFSEKDVVELMEL